MKFYTVYGCGTPIEVYCLSHEIAEAIVVEQYGVKIENITARLSYVVLP